MQCAISIKFVTIIEGARLIFAPASSTNIEPAYGRLSWVKFSAAHWALGRDQSARSDSTQLNSKTFSRDPVFFLLPRD